MSTASEPGDETRRVLPNLVRLLDGIARGDRVDPELGRRLDAVGEYLMQEDDDGRPFLTVLLRTQGKRLEPFKDALLCLLGQSSQDFEVVVLVHDAEPDAAQSVRDIVARQPAGLRARTRLIDVEGGTRARPLNVGVEAATGRYLAVYDDDDLLFGHWVETFQREAVLNRNRLIRTVVANQSVAPERWAEDRDGFRALSWPKPEYPADFDQLEHLLVNSSPFMSWAFPRELFDLYGVRFDEELLVTEDWDVILRGSLLCGVDGARELTAIYRRWTGGASSYSIHSSEEWSTSEQRVIDRLDGAVIMLPPGTMSRVRRALVAEDALQSHRYLFKGNQLRQPLLLAWRTMAPGVRVAVRARNLLRRLRS